MDLVDEIHLTVALTEFVFGIHEDQSALGGNLLSTLEDLAGVVFHHGVILCRDDTLGDNLFLRDVHVVTFVSLRRRGDDGLGEAFVLLHTVGQLHAAELTAAVLVLSPSRTCKDRADNHLHTESLTLQTDGYHRVGCSQLPVGADVCGGVQELGGYLVQHLSLEGDALRQHHVESRDAVCGYHHHQVVVDIVHVTDFSVVNTLLSFKIEVCSC